MADWRECKLAGSTDVTEYAGDWRYCHEHEIRSVKTPEDCARCPVPAALDKAGGVTPGRG